MYTLSSRSKNIIEKSAHEESLATKGCEGSDGEGSDGEGSRGEECRRERGPRTDRSGAQSRRSVMKRARLHEVLACRRTLFSCPRRQSPGKPRQNTAAGPEVAESCLPHEPSPVTRSPLIRGQKGVRTRRVASPELHSASSQETRMKFTSTRSRHVRKS